MTVKKERIKHKLSGTHNYIIIRITVFKFFYLVAASAAARTDFVLYVMFFFFHFYYIDGRKNCFGKF